MFKTSEYFELNELKLNWNIFDKAIKLQEIIFNTSEMLIIYREFNWFYDIQYYKNNSQ